MEKKYFNRKVVSAVVLGIAGVAAAVGLVMPDEKLQSIIDVIMMVVGVFG